MRIVILLTCLVAGAARVYPESPISSASRTTGLPQAAAGAASQPSLVSEAQVYQWLERWQQRLALQDWKIEAKIVRIWDLPKGTVANIHWSLSKKQATIKVLHSADSRLPESEIMGDTELSVVHELIHLSMAKLPLDSVNTELEEEAVKKISTALLNLGRTEQNDAPSRTAHSRP